MRRMILACVVIIGCGGGQTTPAGPVGAPIDLRSHITDAAVAARAPADDKAEAHEHVVDVHGVKAKIVWRTFQDGTAKYIVSAQWEVVTPAGGVSLTPLGVLSPTNAGTVEAPVQAEIVRIRWGTKGACSSQAGEQSLRIDANGVATAL